MLIIISNLFSSILILFSIIGYGNIFYNQRKDNDLFFIIIAGYFILGFLLVFVLGLLYLKRWELFDIYDEDDKDWY